MVRVSVIRVKGESDNSRVRKYGQAMKQFEQVTLLNTSSHMETVKMEFIQMIIFQNFVKIFVASL